METEITKDGISYKNVQGTAEENKALAEQLRAPLQTARRGDPPFIPPVEKWRGLNPHLK